MDWSCQELPPNNRVESNRRCLSAPVFLVKLESAFCAPPVVSPAVAHSKRWTVRTLEHA